MAAPGLVLGLGALMVEVGVAALVPAQEVVVAAAAAA